MQRRNNQRNRQDRVPRFGSTTPNRLYAQTFPRELKVTLKYSELLSFSSSAFSPNDSLFNLNSIFDPYRTGTGHQPMGHDQWATFYGRYRVDGCTVILKGYCVNGGGASTIFSITGNNSAAAYTSTLEPIESPMTSYKLYASGGPAAEIRKKFNLADLTGVTRAVYNADDRYQAAFGSNPTEAMCAHICSYCIDGSIGQMNLSIELQYEVTLFDPIQLGTS